jgi:hypothetical protein
MSHLSCILASVVGKSCTTKKKKDCTIWNLYIKIGVCLFGCNPPELWGPSTPLLDLPRNSCQGSVDVCHLMIFEPLEQNLLNLE